MKKAKLMLSAICIFAVVGSAFAFSANKFNTHFIYTGALTQEDGATACTTQLSGAAISNGTALVRASTVSTTINCPSVFTVAVTD